VIEHVSKGRRNRQRDYEAKRREYLDAGSPEYWVIDRFRRSFSEHDGEDLGRGKELLALTGHQDAGDSATFSPTGGVS